MYPGYVSTVLITPSVHVTENVGQDVSDKKRNCRYNHDLGLNLTNHYSQSGCKFECQLSEANKFCGCVPWDYPHISQEKFEKVCDYFGKVCFEQIMTNFSNTDIKCSEVCPPECFSHR